MTYSLRIYSCFRGKLRKQAQAPIGFRGGNKCCPSKGTLVLSAGDRELDRLASGSVGISDVFTDNSDETLSMRLRNTLKEQDREKQGKDKG